MDEFTLAEKRALAVITIIALIFGAYFLRGYFILIVVAVVAAYLFDPLYERFNKRFGKGLSATFTVLSALAMVIIPVSLLITLAIYQITAMVGNVADWVERTDPSKLGERLITLINDFLARIPFIETRVTEETLRDGMATASQRIGEWLLGFLQSAVTSVAGAVTAAIIFLFVFVSLLNNGDKVRVIVRQLNPLGEDVTEYYLTKMGAMVRGTVRGQFIIALFQGIAGALSIYIAGFHDGYFIFAIVLTALSIIPLGSGIVTIPFGIGMALFGNVVGGIFVVLWHFIVVTNIDNFLRPILVPREARLDPALMLLSVFSGIAMFGFWGIIIGPVIMIVIVTTISVYLWVYKGVELQEHEKRVRRRRWRFLRRKAAREAATAPPPDAEQAKTEAEAESEAEAKAPQEAKPNAP